MIRQKFSTYHSLILRNEVSRCFYNYRNYTELKTIFKLLNIAPLEKLSVLFIEFPKCSSLQPYFLKFLCKRCGNTLELQKLTDIHITKQFLFQVESEGGNTHYQQGLQMKLQQVRAKIANIPIHFVILYCRHYSNHQYIQKKSLSLVLEII